MINANDILMVIKQYQFDAQITFECDYPDLATAMKADVPTNFDKYELVNFKLVKSLTKNEGETNANNVSASTKSQ